MSIELRHLDAFLAVAAAGSFSLAAVRTYTTQPTVSRHVAALEKHLGVPLLLRTAGGVVPTAAGRRLIPYAEHLLEAAAGLRASLDHDGNGPAAAEVPGPQAAVLPPFPLGAGRLVPQRARADRPAQLAPSL